MLRLGYDAKRLFHNFTGLGNYSRSLLSDLQRYYPQHEYHLYSPKLGQHPRTEIFRNNPPWQLHTATGGPAAYWRSYGIRKDLQQQGIQLFHGLSHELPIGLKKTKVRSVVTIHDLIFKSHPELFPFVDRHIYDWKFRYACRNADQIVAISESTRQDIIRWYGIAPEKIKVVYQTCHEQFKQAIPAEQITRVRTHYNLPQAYLLSVGALIERKNLLGLIKAWERLPKSLQIPIVVVGEGAPYRRRIEQHLVGKAWEKSVIFLDRLQFSDLPALYHEAEALVYPSFYEGFGIPLIEALFCGTPTLTSQVSSLPEAAGPGAQYVDPNDEKSLLAGLQTLLDSTAYRDALQSKGKAYVQQFHSEPLAKAMMAVYQKALG